MDRSRLRGIFTPILTPLSADERVDHGSLRRLIDFLLDGGVHGIWIMGTTGEFAALPEDERARAIETTVEHVRGRVPVVANVGDSSTGLALRHARHAVAAGADVLAATPPHYYPHSMDEVLAHFRAVKQAVPDRPLLIYNIPSTVKVKMALGTTLELAREGTVDGIKDSQNDLQWFRNLALGLRDAGLADRFRLFLGTRTLVDAGVAIGAHGAIPAISNVAPAPCAEAYEAAARGDFAAAARAQELVIRYENLSQVARGGSGNAATISTMKHVLHVWDVIADPAVTRPLRPLADDEVAELRRRLELLPAAAPGRSVEEAVPV
jgi:4-hydroxy-tetrahydrodipicolinate synthase